MRRRVLCAFVWTFLFCALMPLASADSFPLYKGLGPGALADYVNAAITAIQKGDLDTAEKALLNAMVLAPNEPHAMALLAEVEMRRGRPANALKYLQANIQRNPTSAVPEEAMGRYLAERKDYSGAESALKKSVGLDPMWVDARLSLGDLYLSQRKFAEALATYRSAVQLAPNSGSAHLSLASGLAAAGNSQSSESELRNAIRLMPQSARAHVALGNLLSLKGTDDVAIGEYETAIKLEPGNSGTYNLIGMAQKKQGRTNLAEQAYRKALALQPNDVVALTNLAWIEMQDPHRVSEALTYAERAAQAAPKVAEVVDTLGWAYHLHGDNDKALQTLKDGVTLAPQNPTVLYHLAVIYAGQNQPKEAEDLLKKALAVHKDFPEMNDARTRLRTITGLAQ